MYAKVSREKSKPVNRQVIDQSDDNKKLTTATEQKTTCNPSHAISLPAVWSSFMHNVIASLDNILMPISPWKTTDENAWIDSNLRVNRPG